MAFPLLMILWWSCDDLNLFDDDQQLQGCYHKLICIWLKQNTKRTVVVTIPMFTLEEFSTCLLLTSPLLWWWRWWMFIYRNLEDPAASECLRDTATSTLYPLPKRWEREKDLFQDITLSKYVLKIIVHYSYLKYPIQKRCQHTFEETTITNMARKW